VDNKAYSICAWLGAGRFGDSDNRDFDMNENQQKEKEKNQMIEESYEPCGPEWKAEMMKWTKKDLVEFCAKTCIELAIAKEKSIFANNFVSAHIKKLISKYLKGLPDWQG